MKRAYALNVRFYVSIRIGSTPTFFYFDLYLNTAYAAHYIYFYNRIVFQAEVALRSNPGHTFKIINNKTNNNILTNRSLIYSI